MKPIPIPMTTQGPGKQPVLICVRARSKKTGESIAVIAAERGYGHLDRDPRLVSIKGA